MRLPLALIALCLPFPLAAQTAADQKDILVEGRKTMEHEAAKAYVDNLTKSTGTQMARYHAPICPFAIGVSAPFADAIRTRIQDDARAVGIEVDENPKCGVNLLVVVSKDGTHFVRDARSRRPAWFTGMDTPGINQIMRAAPVHAWNVAIAHDDSGRPIGELAEGTGNISDPLSSHPMTVSHSFSYIKESERQDVEMSFVVMDQSAILGMSVQQIADYAAMRSFARTRVPKAEGNGALPPTILALFDAPAPLRPDGLTPADRAYLGALYKMAGYEKGREMRTTITQSMQKGK